MQLPLEITWRGVEPSPHLTTLIERRAAKLDRFARPMMRCEVTIERKHEHPRSGSGWGVRIEITIPPSHDIVVVRRSWQGNVRDDLYSVINDAFRGARRQIERLTQVRRGDTKRHFEQELQAVITKLFPQGFGFVLTSEGREVYFHKNSVLDIDFEDLKTGMGVSISEATGEKGPQASTVRVVDRRGKAQPERSGGEARQRPEQSPE